MKTFDELFSAFSESNGGENLEYDAAFLALQQAVVEKPEQQFGDTIIDAQAPDWNQVEKQALALCDRTCDLRVIQALACAWTSQSGLAGYACGVRLAHDALQRCWAGVYPQLVEDDYEDPLPRINAINSLADMQGVGRSVRNANLLTGAHGQLSLRDAESIMEGARARNGRPEGCGTKPARHCGAGYRKAGYRLGAIGHIVTAQFRADYNCNRQPGNSAGRTIR